MTTPSQPTPWQAANVDPGDGGLAHYATLGEAEWKARILESATKSLLSLGMWALKVPLVDDLTEAITGDGPVDLNNDGIPDLQQVTEFLESKWDLVDNIGDAVALLTDAFMAVLKAAGGDFSDITKLPEQAVEVITSMIRKLAGGLLGNIELGQLFRAQAGAEKNWLGTFDTPESVPAGDGFDHDAVVGRTRPGSARVTFDGAEHVRLSDPIEAAPGQSLSLGGYVRWDDYVGSGPSLSIRALAYSRGDQLLGSHEVGSFTPSAGSSADFETMAQSAWAAPANTAYVYVRMEAHSGGTGGTAHFDDLWLRKPAQSLPQQWVEGLTGALSNLGQGVTDAWNFVQATIDNFMNGRGIVGSLFSLGHFQDEVAKVFGPGSSIPQANVSGLTSALANVNSYVQDLVNAILRAIRGIPVVGGTLADIIAEVGGLNTKAVTAQETAEQTAQGVVGGWIGSGASTGDVYDTMQAIRRSIESGMAVQTFTSSATWTRPSDMNPAVPAVVIGIGSGSPGAVGGVKYTTSYVDSGGYTNYVDNPGEGGAGGVGGGYLAMEFTYDELPASAAVTVGTNGGEVSLGSLLVTKSSVSSMAVGNIGFAASTSRGASGGNGGRGGNSSDGTTAPAWTYGAKGGDTPLANGGPGGKGGDNGNAVGTGRTAPVAGLPGNPASASASSTKCGGGGGGGGGGGTYSGTTTRNGAPGGPGGFPGGGGGGGGGTFNGSPGAGGVGGGGVLFFIYKPL